MQTRNASAAVEEEEPKPGAGVKSGSDVTPGNNLSLRQAAALTTLAQTGSISQAASAAGVSRKTIFQWLRKDNFRFEVQALQRGMLEAAATRYSGLLHSALETICEALSSKDEKVSLRAAEIYLSKAAPLLESAETDLRLRKIEQRLGLMGSNQHAG